MIQYNGVVCRFMMSTSVIKVEEAANCVNTKHPGEIKRGGGIPTRSKTIFRVGKGVPKARKARESERKQKKRVRRERWNE